MNGKTLLDTSVIIDSARQRDKSQVITEIVFKGLDPVISIVTLTELWGGRSMQTDKEARYVNTFLQGVEIISLNEEISILAGKLLWEYPNLEDPIDRIIAATALSHDLTLITYNPKHFRVIKGLKILEPKYSSD